MRYAAAADVLGGTLARFSQQRAETAYFRKHLEPHFDGDNVDLVGEVDEVRKQPFLAAAAALLRKALRAYAKARQLPSSDAPTADLWNALRVDERPVITNYTMVERDVAGPFLRKLPSKMEDMKDIPKLGYTSPREALAEKFHMSEQLLAMLNPGRGFDRAGDTIAAVGDGRRSGRGRQGGSGGGRQDDADGHAFRQVKLDDRLLSGHRNHLQRGR